MISDFERVGRTIEMRRRPRAKPFRRLARKGGTARLETKFGRPRNFRLRAALNQPPRAPEPFRGPLASHPVEKETESSAPGPQARCGFRIQFMAMATW